MTAKPIDLSRLAWRKAAASSNANNCVELAPIPGGGAAVRDTKNRAGGALILDAAAFGAFLAGAKRGDFDLH